jgi:hypothetical protein
LDQRTSDHDILLQLFSERKIARVELLAGRMWQELMHDCSIQPASSIDFATPAHLAGLYQVDGDLSERQFKAMRKRAILRRSLGPEAFAMLDVLLSPDVGRREILRAYRWAGRGLIQRLQYCLKEVAVCLSLSTRILYTSHEADPNAVAQTAILDMEVA